MSDDALVKDIWMRELLHPKPKAEAKKTDLASWRQFCCSHGELHAEVLKQPQPEIVTTLIPEKAICIMIGESTIGKTPLAGQLAVAVVHGVPFLGLQTRQGRVMWVDYENSRNTTDTLLAALSGFLGTPCPVSAELMIVRSPATREQVYAAVKSFKPQLVVVDALRGFDSAAETKNESTSDLYAQLNQFDTAWLLIHHPRKSSVGENKPISLKDAPSVIEWMQRSSGANALQQQAHIRIAVEEEKDGLRVLWNYKGEGDRGPFLLSRELDGDGIPAGYQRKLGTNLLKDGHSGFLGSLPKGKKVKFSDVEELTGLTRKKTSAFLLDCENCGLVTRTGKPRSPEAGYLFQEAF
jgi:hypothetical protein